jgi:hypothetical protein
MKLKKRISYFLSGWMANFGVEPLLLLLFLRFLPLFFTFLILLSSVCLVGETMLILLLAYCIITQYRYHHFKRKRLIHWTLTNVKRFTFSTNYPNTLGLLLTLGQILVWPLSTSMASTATAPIEVIISVGEHHEIRNLKASQISIGNPQVLGHLYRTKTNTLLLKGKKVGYSHIIYWLGTNTKNEIHVYIVSKRDQLKMGQAINFLKELKINARFSGDQLVVENELISIDQYKALKSLVLKNPGSIHFKGSINPKLAKEILLEVYADFWSHHLDSVRCQIVTLEVQCELFESDGISTQYETELVKKHQLVLHKVPSPLLENYRIRLKVIQLESADELAIKSGLEQFTGSISNFFHFSLEEIIGKNSWNFSSQNLSYKLLAEPEILLSLGRKAEIKVGTELGFQNQNEERGVNQRDWKETGLNITLELIRQGNHFLLDYKHSMSRGENIDSISFGHGKSTILLELGSPTKLFEVTLDSDQKNKARLPFIGAIPILGNLFGSHQQMELYQKLTCLLILEKV